MAIISTLSKLGGISKAVIGNGLLAKKQNAIIQALRRMSDDRTMHITPSRFQYTRFKDDLHFYLTLGIVPLGLLILYVNIFIGPATLTEIPEGYEPEEHEYYKHPISRFISKHFLEHPQISYERNLHHFWELREKQEWSETVTKVEQLMAQRDDYKAWYFIPSDQGRHIRRSRYDIDKLYESRGYQ